MIDYDSDTIVPVGNEPKPNKPVSRETSRVAPNPLSGRVTAHTLTALRISSTLEEDLITNGTISNYSNMSMLTKELNVYLILQLLRRLQITVYF